MKVIADSVVDKDILVIEPGEISETTGTESNSGPWFQTSEIVWKKVTGCATGGKSLIGSKRSREEEGRKELDWDARRSGIAKGHVGLQWREHCTVRQKLII